MAISISVSAVKSINGPSTDYSEIANKIIKAGTYMVSSFTIGIVSVIIHAISVSKSDSFYHYNLLGLIFSIENTGFMNDIQNQLYNKNESIDKSADKYVADSTDSVKEKDNVTNDKQKNILETDENNSKRRKTMYNINMEEGEKFYGTYADLLNHLGFRTKTGARFSNYQKSTYELDPHVYVWIASIDGNERNGWINQFEGVDKIVEYNIDNKVHSIGLTHEYRYVFQKCKNNSGKQYFIYRGVYLLNRSMSNNAKRVLEKTDL